MVTKTYTRIAHRVESHWGRPGDTWRIEGKAYICNSGLTQHFDIPFSANELEVEIIVSKRRPDVEAQRIWGYNLAHVPILHDPEPFARYVSILDRRTAELETGN